MKTKVKVTKEDIISKAVELVRQSGAASLNARGLASALGCSTQPIFSNFSNMDELKLAVAERAEKIYIEFISRETESQKYPPYKASGMAYIRFAREEKNLFDLLYMRDRTNEKAESDSNELFTGAVKAIQNSLELSEDDARLFHIEMWICVHGMAAITATNYLELDEELVSRILTDNFVGLKMRFGVNK